MSRKIERVGKLLWRQVYPLFLSKIDRIVNLLQEWRIPNMQEVSLAGVLVCGLIPILYLLLIGVCLYTGGGYGQFRNVRKRDLLLIQLVFLLSTMFVFLLIRQNQYIYYWDYGREWTGAIETSRQLLAQPVEAIKNIIFTINTMDFNRFMPILLGIFLAVFDESYTTYVVFNFIICVLPSFLIYAMCVKKLLHITGEQEGYLPLIVFCFSLTPLVYYTVLHGFMDPILCTLSGLVFFLSIDMDFKQKNLKQCSLIAVLLLCITISRRHFPIWVLGYIATMGVLFLFQLFSTEINKRKQLIQGFFINMCFIGICIAAVLLLLFRGYIKLELSGGGNYGNAYDGLRDNNVISLVKYVGGSILLIAVLGGMLLAWKKKTLRAHIVALETGFITIFLIYSLMGGMDYFHSIVFFPHILLLFFVVVMTAINHLKQYVHRCIAWCVVVAVLCSNFLTCFVSGTAEAVLPDDPMLTALEYTPSIREDIDEIEDLVEELNELSADGKDIYVLASSDVLNSNLLAMSKMPETSQAIPQLNVTHDVDTTQGFPASFLESEIIVVADPIQTHLTPGYQEVVVYLAQQILDPKSYLGVHYQQVSEYILENEVKAKVYIKTSDLTEADYIQLQQYYDSIYPDMPELFHDRIQYPESYFSAEPGKTITLTNTSEYLNSLMNGADQPSTGEGYLVYGPYQSIEAGVYEVQFTYQYTGNLEDGSKIGTVDALMDGTTQIETKEFYAGDSTVVFQVELEQNYERAEFRMFTYVPDVLFQKMSIVCISSIDSGEK